MHALELTSPQSLSSSDTTLPTPSSVDGEWQVGKEIYRPPDEVMDFIREVDGMLKSVPEATMELDHIFTPGIYIRQIFIRKGILLTSEIHATEHPFQILGGKIFIYYPGEAIVVHKAPHIGITTPGTVRVLYSLEDTLFATIHANPDDERDVDKIKERITLPRIHKLK